MNSKNRFLSILLGLCCIVCIGTAQPAWYSVGNAHSHNDYLQPQPFAQAYAAGFGSIEADIFLENDQLLVSHDTTGLQHAGTLQKLYLEPLSAAINRNHGQVYENNSTPLFLLIDLKTPAGPLLQKLMQVLDGYPELKACKSLKLVITGNQPEVLTDYPGYLYFDGLLSRNYTPAELQKVALYSDSFKKYSNWDGTGTLPQNDRGKLIKSIKSAHLLHKPIRFWAAPDTPAAWRELMLLGVDYINTDRIAALAAFLKQ